MMENLDLYLVCSKDLLGCEYAVFSPAGGHSKHDCLEGVAGAVYSNLFGKLAGVFSNSCVRLYSVERSDFGEKPSDADLSGKPYLYAVRDGGVSVVSDMYGSLGKLCEVKYILEDYLGFFEESLV